MKQFKVGDTVRLKKNLKVGKMYGGLTLLSGMVFDGVKEIKSTSIPNLVFFQEGYEGFGYTTHMLIKVKPED